METVIDKLEWLFAALVTFISWYFGGFDGFFYALVAFVVMDYVTGLLKAAIRKELSSIVGLRGIAKKIAIFVLVGMAHILDAQILGHGEVLRDMVIFFYLANEGISILENAVEMGIPVPDFLKEKLLQIRDRDKGAADIQKKPRKTPKQELM